MADKESDVKVSILCSTYDHANYIKRALDSFLMQKTNFKFDVLINDDASTDGTTEILKSYQNKFPDIIKPNIQKENLYSKGYRSMMARFLLPKAQGRYIALCEGDDYWTDPDKLQKQVDFLEKNKDYAMCFHPVKVVFEDNEKEDYIFPSQRSKNYFTIENLLRSNFIQTNSVMYRKQKNYSDLSLNVEPGDWYMHLYHARFGKIGFIDKVMSVYNRHPGGLWEDSYKNKTDFWRKHGLAHINTYNEILKLYGDKKEHRNIIGNSIDETTEAIILADDSHDKKLVKELLLNLRGEMEKLRITNELLRKKAHKLEMIKQSRVWKLRNEVAKLFGKEPI